MEVRESTIIVVGIPFISVEFKCLWEHFKKMSKNEDVSLQIGSIISRKIWPKPIDIKG